MRKRQILIMFSVVLLLMAFSLTACETMDNLFNNDGGQETPNNQPNTPGNQNNSNNNSNTETDNQDRQMEQNRQQN